MTPQYVLNSQQCQNGLQRLGPAGSWVLPAGCAVTLNATTGAALHVTQGLVWATLDGPHSGPANDLGDLMLHAGERMALKAGQRVVIEAYEPAARAGGGAGASARAGVGAGAGRAGAAYFCLDF